MQKLISLYHLRSMMKGIFCILLGGIGLTACSDSGSGSKKSIVMGDSSTIVTETDPKYLANYTEDIAPNNHKSSAKQIAQMMVEVDSLKATQKLENQPAAQAPVEGFKVSFNEFDITFSGLYAHAAQSKPLDKSASSLSFIYDAGELAEMRIQVSNLTEVSIDQKISTKLKVEGDKEYYLLGSLGQFHSSWFHLVGKNSIFLGTGNNGIQFHEVTQPKIQQALATTLRNKRKNAAQTKTILSTVARTSSANQPPCKIAVSAVQFVIKGTYQGKKIKKLIRLDVPL